MRSHSYYENQLATELADLELEVERLQKDEAKTQSMFAKNKTGWRIGAVIFMLIGIAICFTGVGAIFGFPIICYCIYSLVNGGSPSKKEQLSLENIQNDLFKKKKRLTELRAMVQVGSSSFQADDNDDEEIRVKCPYCAERILQEARICRFCGKTINQATI